MPLQRLQFKPGFVRDTTALAAEGGWYEGNNVRFRRGFPEKIGGWQRISSALFQGVCRTLTAWRTLAGSTLYGMGTHLKMYVALGGVYYDITPVRQSVTTAANAFTTTNGSPVVTATAAAHGAATGDFVAISGAATTVGGITTTQINGDYQITVVTANTFTFVVSSNATSGATGGNGVFDFQIAPGTETAAGTSGWGAGGYGNSGYGQSAGTIPMRIWSQVPYGELLVYGPRGGPMYQFTPPAGVAAPARGVLVSSLGGASAVPLTQNAMLFSPAARILVLCGTNSIAGAVFDPLLVRWSDSDSIVQWTPSASNQAGEYRLPQGSSIVATANARQDTLILTDTTAYLMQYIGAPYIFGFTQQADNISIAGPNAVVAAGGVVFWMGADKFYYYDGRVQPLDCPLLNEVFNSINAEQSAQFFAGTSEGFNEVWWWYCSAGVTVPDRYVTFNYVSKAWAYGSMTRTAWLDTPLSAGPLAATYVKNLVQHEIGVDDSITATPQPITAYARSSDFDIGDGQNYAFVSKLLPDVSFAGSTISAPAVTMTLQGRKNPGGTVSATPAQVVTLTATSPDLRWTDELSVRLRARQMNIEIRSTAVGVKWQFGTPRLNVRPDGRAS